jgi:hypothetical protein
MSDVHDRPRSGQGSDPHAARTCLALFVKAAQALGDAWDPVLERPTYPAYFPPFNELLSLLIEWQADVEGRLSVNDSDLKPLNFSDPVEVRSWLTALTTQIEDIAAAAEDATRPSDRRRLGRAAARGLIIEARAALLHIVKVAERSVRSTVPRPPGGPTTH